MKIVAQSEKTKAKIIENFVEYLSTNVNLADSLFVK